MGRGKPQPLTATEIARLKRERQRLSSRLNMVDAKLGTWKRSKRRPPTSEEVDRWLDELSAGLPDLPSLPRDFSRADLYDDHD